MDAPESALDRLAEHLLEDPVIAPHVGEPASEPVIGLLVAAGPRSAEAPGEYAFLVEAIREGYLLHYASPRLLAGADRDLRLLAGDYLYALGLERLACRGDLIAVRELADLISLSAQLHARSDGEGPGTAEALWLLCALAVGVGPDGAHDGVKVRVRSGDASLGLPALVALARERAQGHDLGHELEAAAEQVGFAARSIRESG